MRNQFKRNDKAAAMDLNPGGSSTKGHQSQAQLTHAQASQAILSHASQNPLLKSGNLKTQKSTIHAQAQSVS